MAKRVGGTAGNAINGARYFNPDVLFYIPETIPEFSALKDNSPPMLRVRQKMCGFQRGVDIMKKSRKTREKLLCLVGIYDRIYEKISPMDDKLNSIYRNSWQVSRGKYFDIIDGRITGVKISSLVNGLEQGLMEFPAIINSLPFEARERAEKIYYDEINSAAPDFFDKNKIRAVIERGSIKMDSEFYMVRAEIDRMERCGDSDKLAYLDKLTGDYERK